MSTKVDAKELENKLAYFTGSEEFTRTHRNVIATEGVMYLAEQAQCYWLLDIVASYQTTPKVRNEEFQVYKLTVDLKKCKAVVVITDGNDNILAKQTIPYTDFPLSEITLWYTNGTVMLPSEY